MMYIFAFVHLHIYTLTKGDHLHIYTFAYLHIN